MGPGDESIELIQGIDAEVCKTSVILLPDLDDRVTEFMSDILISSHKRDKKCRIT